MFQIRKELGVLLTSFAAASIAAPRLDSQLAEDVVAGLPCEPGDFNGDGLVDLEDHSIMIKFDYGNEDVVCFKGPAVVTDPRCGCVDVNSDGSIDLLDHAELAVSFTGSK